MEVRETKRFERGTGRGVREGRRRMRVSIVRVAPAPGSDAGEVCWTRGGGSPVKAGQECTCEHTLIIIFTLRIFCNFLFFKWATRVIRTWLERMESKLKG